MKWTDSRVVKVTVTEERIDWFKASLLLGTTFLGTVVAVLIGRR